MRRIRVLIYECDDPAAMNKQLANSVQGTKVVNAPTTGLWNGYRSDRAPLTIQAIDVDLARITLLEVWQLVKMEWQATLAEVKR